MTDNITDLKSFKFCKTLDGYMDSISSIYQSEAAFFKEAKFAPFADSFIDSGFDREYFPTFHVLIDFRHYKPSEEALALLRRLKADRFEIVPQNFSKEYRAEIRRKPLDAPGCYGPFASAQIGFEEARGIFSARDEGRLGAYQPSSSGFRTVFRENWDDRGVGSRIVVCGHDARRSRFEEHIIDDDRDMSEVSTMMARIQAARNNESDGVVPFRR
ncbi:hypothetical protein G6L37_01350 [Agrobacterium rubi]|nr:hypothetical protein [Agrobacterium rubi]NTF24038.1 hypothetical protein [Agrobacterium rubi]